MRRRRFVRQLAGAAALPLLPSAPEGFAGLRRDLARAPDDRAYWKAVRAGFMLRPGLSHLNCGTIGATPRVVVEAHAAALWDVESDPQANVFGAPSHRMEEVRAHAADFLGATLDEVALTRNTTEGMNEVARGLDLRRGDQVLTTTHEHPGGSVCWEHLARRIGVEIVRIDMPRTVSGADEILELVSSHITPRTRVCSFSHVTTVTGLVMPMAAIAKLTRPRDILLVCDGAQAPGMLNVDVAALGVDTYASSSHKWMLAPKGSGLLYIRKAVQDRVRPLFLESGYRAYTASSGTRNVPAILAHGAAMEFHNTIGRDRVEARCRALSRHLRGRLEHVPDVTILTPVDERLSGGIVTISLDRGNARAVRSTMYRDYGIVLKAGRAEYNAIRVSTHVFNDEDEIDRAVDILARVMAAG